MRGIVSHLDVCNRNWVQAGASVWLLRPDARPEAGVREEDRVGQGEILAFRVGDMALRLWTRSLHTPRTASGGLRLSIKSTGPVLVGEVSLIDLPTVGTTFWVRPPAAWTAYERRRAFRVPVNAFARVWLPGEKEALVRRVVDLSVAGARLEGIPARLDERVRLELELAPVRPVLEVEATVRRQESAAMGAYTGVEFSLAPGQEEVILQYLLHVSARHLISALTRR
jgi:hypothetical protein